MFERFTTGARAAVVEAQQVARDLGDARITPAHLVVAVASVADPAAEVLAAHGADRAALLDRFDDAGLDPGALAALGIDLDAVRRRADTVFGAGALDRADRARRGGGRRTTGHLPFTRDAKKTLEVALREALRLGHRRIEAGHVLLAVVRLSDADGHALLRRAGVDPAALAADVAARLGGAAAACGPRGTAPDRGPGRGRGRRQSRRPRRGPAGRATARPVRLGRRRAPGYRGPVTAEPQPSPPPSDLRAAVARRRRTLRWVVPLVVGVPLLAVLVVATVRVSVWAAVGLLAIGLLAVAVATVLRRGDRRRADRLAPADPALRANPPLDVERVRALGRQGGRAAAVREVRRQAPWLGLVEAAELADRIG